MHSHYLYIAGFLGASLAHPTASQTENSEVPSRIFQKRDPSATANPPAAVTTINDNDGVGSGSNTYVQYSGDGSTGAGWPALSDWVSFGDMWDNLQGPLSSSCSQYGVPNNSADELSDMYSAIEAVAQESGVDHRLILAEIMQESTGCVRVPTTTVPSYGIYNPGLMQDYDGYYTCNCEQNDEYGEDCGVVNPCPSATIQGMIREGTQGTDNGDGLATLINQAQSQGTTDAQTFYVAAWWYNQGSSAQTSDLGTYAVDIANYLTGWQG